MTAPRRRRMLAGVVGIAALAGLAIVPSAQMTEAQFTDSEYASSSTFTAQTLVTPVITGCTVQNNGLGIFQSVTLTWTALYPLANVRLTATSGTTTGTVPPAGITVSGPVACTPILRRSPRHCSRASCRTSSAARRR